MKHQWKTNGPDDICRHCAKLRSGSNDDNEDCPVLAKRAQSELVADDRDLEQLDALAKQIKQAEGEDDSPVQFQLDVLRRQMLELVDILRGDSD